MIGQPGKGVEWPQQSGTSMFIDLQRGLEMRLIKNNSAQWPRFFPVAVVVSYGYPGTPCMAYLGVMECQGYCIMIVSWCGTECDRLGLWVQRQILSYCTIAVLLLTCFLQFLPFSVEDVHETGKCMRLPIYMVSFLYYEWSIRLRRLFAVTII